MQRVWDIIGFTSVVLVVVLSLFAIKSAAGSHKSNVFQPQKAIAAPITFEETAGLPSPNRVLELVNDERTRRRLKPLQPNSELEQVALKRAQDMSVNVYYAHQNSTGGFYDDIMLSRGLKTDYSCENLELSFETLPEIYVSDWLKSTDHRVCLLNQNITQAGYAVTVVDLPNGEGKQSIVVVAIHSTDIK